MVFEIYPLYGPNRGKLSTALTSRIQHVLRDTGLQGPTPLLQQP